MYVLHIITILHPTYDGFTYTNLPNITANLVFDLMFFYDLPVT